MQGVPNVAVAPMRTPLLVVMLEASETPDTDPSEVTTFPVDGAAVAVGGTTAEIEVSDHAKTAAETPVAVMVAVLVDALLTDPTDVTVFAVVGAATLRGTNPIIVVLFQVVMLPDGTNVPLMVTVPWVAVKPLPVRVKVRCVVPKPIPVVVNVDDGADAPTGVLPWIRVGVQVVMMGTAMPLIVTLPTDEPNPVPVSVKVLIGADNLPLRTAFVRLLPSTEKDA